MTCALISGKGQSNNETYISSKIKEKQTTNKNIPFVSRTQIFTTN